MSFTAKSKFGKDACKTVLIVRPSTLDSVGDFGSVGFSCNRELQPGWKHMHVLVALRHLSNMKLIDRKEHLGELENITARGVD